MTEPILARSGLVPVSLGITGYHGGDTLSTLLAQAEDALHRAKREGRNRIRTAGVPSPPRPRTAGGGPG